MRDKSLRPEDKTLLHAMIRAEMEAFDRFESKVIARSVEQKLRDVEPFDAQVERLVHDLLVDALYLHVKVVHHSERTRVTFTDHQQEEQRVKLPTYRAITSVDPDTGDRVETQTRFTAMAWVEFEAIVFKEQKLLGNQSRKVQAMEVVLHLRDLYPNTITVEQAILAAGMDPSDLDMKIFGSA